MFLLNHFEIGEIEVFVDISVSPFNFANMSSKDIANLAASNVILTHCANTVLTQYYYVFLRLVASLGIKVIRN